MLASMEENDCGGEEELVGRLRRLSPPPPPPRMTKTTKTIAGDLHHPTPSASRARLKPPSFSSSTYRSDYKPAPVSSIEVEKAQSLGLGGGERGRVSTSTTTATRRSSSPPHFCCCCPSSSSSEAPLLPAPPSPRSLSTTAAAAVAAAAAAFDSKENAPFSQQRQPRKLLEKKLQHPQNPQLQQRSARVSGSALSDAITCFREKERNWLIEKAALRRDADAARRQALLSDALRSKEATARRHAEAELKAAKAAIRRRDDDAAVEKERNAAALAAVSASSEARVRSAQRAVSSAASEAATARERIVELEQGLLEERARRDGAEEQRVRALERAEAAVGASRRAAVEFASAVGQEAERSRRAEQRLRERVRKACGVDLSLLSSIAEEEEEEEEEEEGEGEEGEEEGDEEDEEEDDILDAEDRGARLPSVSFTV